MDNPLVQGQYRLEKFPGKGGWTYALIPEIKIGKHSPFGWMRVKGMIDSYTFSQVHLMPVKNGGLFFPVKAAIRKQIKKEAGDLVTIVLYPDYSSVEIPQELQECLQSEPEAYSRFMSLKEGAQKAFIDWIYSAKQEETKVNRMVRTIEDLLAGKKLPSARSGF